MLDIEQTLSSAEYISATEGNWGTTRTCWADLKLPHNSLNA